ncbi:MAG: hypothetical protein A2Z34_07610 [Planctomycetes bacterium RBG_16_59_8]|nr:MAG: hypothetical protein A2Z34_07610 [Planctomycetes bacterium RBG_16_59_8]
MFLCGALGMAACQATTPIVVLDRSYDWRNSFPKLAVYAPVDSTPSVEFRQFVVRALKELGYDDVVMLDADDAGQASVDTQRLGAGLLVVVEVRRFVPRETGDDDGSLRTTMEGRERKDSYRPPAPSRDRYLFHASVRIIDPKRAKTIYDVRHGYQSPSEFFDASRCLKKILWPLASVRKRGAWKQYEEGR